jgi:hypothetical protein
MNKILIEIPLGKRNNYFSGKLLSEEDFNDEQNYMLNKMRLHNRMLHGWGTVSGLEVSASEDSFNGVIVSPGVAIDPFGNEIIVSSAVQCAFPEEYELAYLVLYWAERETDSVPARSAEGESDQTVPSRVEEYAILKYETEDGGNSQNGIVLARLKKERGKWKVDKKYSVRRAKV